MSNSQPISHTSQPGDKTIVVPLDIMGETVTAEHAGVADSLKYGMKFTGGFDINDASVGCGIYWTDEGFFLKRVPSPPPARSSVERPVSGANLSETPQRPNPAPYRYQSYESTRVDQARLVPPLPSAPITVGRAYNPAANANPSRSGFVVVPLGVDAPGSAAAYGYVLELMLDYLVERGSPESPRTLIFERPTTEDDVDLIYRLTVDTGGGVDSWIFAAFEWRQFVHIVGAAPFPPDAEARFNRKRKIGYPPNPAANDSATFRYGYGDTEGQHSVVEVTQTLVRVHCWDFQKTETTRYADKFVIGSARASDGNALLREADGLLALGRWKATTQYTRFKREGTWTSTATTIVGALYNAGHIQYERFYVRITHPGLEIREASFMCFGPFKDITRAANPPGCIEGGSDWSRINCSYVRPTQSPFWMVYLSKISIQSPGVADVTIDVRQRFVLDTGASQSYVPRVVEAWFQNYLNSVNGGEAGQASNIPASATIVFTFGGPAEPENPTTYTEIDVTGQAIRFLVNPLASIAGNGNPACFRRVPEGWDLYLLGLNFFRTFCVGFGDGYYPWVALAPQRHVSHPS